MSVARGYGLNGFHYHTNVCKPIDCNLNFVVDSTNGNNLGIRSLKSNGFVEAVYMNAASTGLPAGSPAMGTARSYAILGASTVTNTGSSALTGNLGLYPGSAITGFPPGTFSGVENIANVAAQNAKASAQAVYTALQALTPTGISSVLNGQTLAAGTYKATSGTAGAFTLDAATGPLTLSGSATDIYVFQTTTTLITGTTGAGVITLGNVLPQNIYWVVGSSATLSSGTAGTFYGNIIALTSITSTTTAGVHHGSLIALNGAVTLSAATTVVVQTPAGGAVGDNPNPLPGYCWVKFKNNFNYYLGGFSGFVSPVSSSNVAVNSTALVLGQAYVIVSLGTSTAADWLAVGVPAGFTAAVGTAFVAIKSGNGSGTGQVRVPVVSGVNSVEVVGDPNKTINNAAIGVNAGAMVLVQFLANSVLTAPANESVCGMCFRFDGSSVTIDGI